MPRLVEVNLMLFLLDQKDFLSVSEILNKTLHEKKLILTPEYVRRFFLKAEFDKNFKVEKEFRPVAKTKCTYYKLTKLKTLQKCLD